MAPPANGDYMQCSVNAILKPKQLSNMPLCDNDVCPTRLEFLSYYSDLLVVG